MRLEFIRNLKGREVLAKNILSNDGSILLKKGITLTGTYVRRLEVNGIYLVYIEDERFDDVASKEDKKIDELKSDTLKNMPVIFDNLLSGNSKSAGESLKYAEDIIDCIISEENINTNLYEVKSYDNYTYIHCLDTGIMATYLGTKLGWDEVKIKELGISAMFHDVGKIKIPSEIINKKGKLTNTEIQLIKKHSEYGEEILKSSNIFSKDITDGVLQHHENFLGQGYPFGLKKDEIGEYAKVISICDVFTAVSANRNYRKRFSPNEAYELILSNSGIMFEPKYVDKFKQYFYIYPLGCKVQLSNGLIGYIVKQNKNFPDRPVVRIVYKETNKNSNYTYDIDLIKNPNIIIVKTI